MGPSDLVVDPTAPPTQRPSGELGVDRQSLCDGGRGQGRSDLEQRNPRLNLTSQAYCKGELARKARGVMLLPARWRKFQRRSGAMLLILVQIQAGPPIL